MLTQANSPDSKKTQTHIGSDNRHNVSHLDFGTLHHPQSQCQAQCLQHSEQPLQATMAHLRVHISVLLQWVLIAVGLFAADAPLITQLLAPFVCPLILRSFIVKFPFHKQRHGPSYLEIYARKPKCYLPELLYGVRSQWIDGFVALRYGHACMIQYRRYPSYSAPSSRELTEWYVPL
jgi:hypothetical protein